MRIDLVDNNIGQSDGANVFVQSDILPLYRYGDKTISKLCEDNRNLLLFPQSFDETKDKVEDLAIYGLQTTADPNNVKIVTGNVMGFFGVDGILMKISSRFDQNNKDFLLHYMLEKVFSFSLFDLNYNSDDEGIFDFLLFTFPYFIKAALRQGIYREYRRIEHNNSKVKGPIDIARHIRSNIPFTGSVAYSTREYCEDNNLTNLIRHTIEYIRTKKFGEAILNHDKETAQCVQDICNCTSYNRSDRQRIIQQNLRPKIHPYYTEYYPLQNLCMQILRMEEVKFGENTDEICGVLFDGAWLWEAYVNTVLDGMGFTHSENKEGTGAIYLFEDKKSDGRIRRSGRRYPDFYKNNFVLDAKYKRIGSLDKVSSVDRDDIHQVITYMHGLGATNGGFIAPLTEKQYKVPSSNIRDGGGKLSIFGIQISKASTYPLFCQEMREYESEFLASLTPFDIH